jgi:hypothetical protein
MLGFDGNAEARVKLTLGSLSVGGQSVVQTQWGARRNLPGTQTVGGRVLILDTKKRCSQKKCQRK